MYIERVIVIFVFSQCLAFTASKQDYEFPEGFKFGVSTAAFQIEGAWNEDGKGPNIWDDDIHSNRLKIVDNSNADVAADSYHKYREDIKLTKELGASVYRFSIAWARILPTGYADNINQAGIDYYNDLIDALIEEGIEPVATMYHFDLPSELQKIGGWINPNLSDIFLDYARVLFDAFGDRINMWTTFNQPEVFCYFGYDIANFPPLINNSGVGSYQCVHTVILSHAKVWRMYDNEYRSKYNGKVGMVVYSHWYAPKDPNNPADVKAAERRMEFRYAWTVDPITFGDYPESMIEYVGAQSRYQGFPKSRLPVFSEQEKIMVKGTYDYLGLNLYTSRLCSEDFKLVKEPDFMKDHGVAESIGDWAPTNSSFIYVTPFAMRNVLKWIDQRYHKPEIVVMENGMSEHSLNDTNKVHYYNGYLSSLLEAIHEDGVNVTIYSCWSLIDNFQLTSGYTEAFGLVHVDFSRKDRKRTPRLSYYNYKKIIETRKITSLNKIKSLY